MLGRYHNCIDIYWNSVHVSECYLRLRIRTEPRESIILSHFCLLFHDTMSIIDWCRHQSICLTTCISEHEPLIPGTLIEIDSLPFIDSLSNIRRLLIIGHHHGECMSIVAEI